MIRQPDKFPYERYSNSQNKNKQNSENKQKTQKQKQNKISNSLWMNSAAVNKFMSGITTEDLKSTKKSEKENIKSQFDKNYQMMSDKTSVQIQNRSAAKLVDLDPEEKAKIGELIKKLAEEKEQKQKMEAELKLQRKKYREKIKKLEQEKQQSFQIQQDLEDKFQESLNVIKKSINESQNQSNPQLSTQKTEIQPSNSRIENNNDSQINFQTQNDRLQLKLFVTPSVTKNLFQTKSLKQINNNNNEENNRLENNNLILNFNNTQKTSDDLEPLNKKIIDYEQNTGSDFYKQMLGDLNCQTQQSNSKSLQAENYSLQSSQQQKWINQEAQQKKVSEPIVVKNNINYTFNKYGRQNNTTCEISKLKNELDSITKNLEERNLRSDQKIQQLDLFQDSNFKKQYQNQQLDQISSQKSYHDNDDDQNNSNNKINNLEREVPVRMSFGHIKVDNQNNSSNKNIANSNNLKFSKSDYKEEDSEDNSHIQEDEHQDNYFNKEDFKNKQKGDYQRKNKFQDINDKLNDIQTGIQNIENRKQQNKEFQKQNVQNQNQASQQNEIKTNQIKVYNKNFQEAKNQKNHYNEQISDKEEQQIKNQKFQNDCSQDEDDIDQIQQQQQQKQKLLQKKVNYQEINDSSDDENELILAKKWIENKKQQNKLQNNQQLSFGKLVRDTSQKQKIQNLNYGSSNSLQSSQYQNYGNYQDNSQLYQGKNEFQQNQFLSNNELRLNQMLSSKKLDLQNLSREQCEILNKELDLKLQKLNGRKQTFEKQDNQIYNNQLQRQQLQQNQDINDYATFRSKEMERDSQSNTPQPKKIKFLRQQSPDQNNENDEEINFGNIESKQQNQFLFSNSSGNKFGSNEKLKVIEEQAKQNLKLRLKETLMKMDEDEIFQLLGEYQSEQKNNMMGQQQIDLSSIQSQKNTQFSVEKLVGGLNSSNKNKSQNRDSYIGKIINSGRQTNKNVTQFNTQQLMHSNEKDQNLFKINDDFYEDNLFDLVNDIEQSLSYQRLDNNYVLSQRQQITNLIDSNFPYKRFC